MRTKASSSDSPPARSSSRSPERTILPPIDDRDAVAQALDDFEHVGRQEDRGAAAHLVLEDVLHQARADGVHAFEGLVHQEQLGMVDQRGRHGDALPHALGVLGDDLAIELELEQLE